MKLNNAASLCEGNSRAFAEVYKIYNYKDDDDLRAYCDFVIHEPAEWMAGFPSAWKSSGMFSKPRAAFHRLLKHLAVVEELGEDYCDNVHSVIWGAFKTHMDVILEKRNKTANKMELVVEDKDKESVLSIESEQSDLTADDLEVAPPVLAAAPRNTVAFNGLLTDYKHKYEVLNSVLETMLGVSQGAVGKEGWFQLTQAPADENARLRAAFKLLLAEFVRA